MIWRPELVEALRSSRVFVALYSGAFFISYTCGQELRVFLMRRQRATRGEGTPLST
jgi:hypothetical protein